MSDECRVGGEGGKGRAGKERVELHGRDRNVRLETGKGGRDCQVMAEHEDATRKGMGEDRQQREFLDMFGFGRRHGQCRQAVVEDELLARSLKPDNLAIGRIGDRCDSLAVPGGAPGHPFNRQGKDKGSDCDGGEQKRGEGCRVRDER